VSDPHVRHVVTIIAADDDSPVALGTDYGLVTIKGDARLTLEESMRLRERLAVVHGIAEQWEREHGGHAHGPGGTCRDDEDGL
jgi:hypothetical protein